MRTDTKRLFSVLTLLLMMAAGGGAWATNTFTVAIHSGSTFRITRTGDTTIAETVDWRVVSLSALEGTHYTGHNGNYSGAVTFNVNDTYVDVTIAETTPGADAYKYQDGTTRKYRFEVLDKDGHILASCDRSRNYGTSVTSAAFNVKDIIVNSGTDTITDANYSQAYHAVPVATYFNNAAPKSYLIIAGAELRMTLSFKAKEKDDGYQHIQILVNQTGNHDEGSGNDNPGDMNYSSYMACFCHKGGSENTTYSNYVFPDVTHGHNCGNVGKVWSNINTTNDVGELRQQYFNTDRRATDGRLIISSTDNLSDFNTLGYRFDASGKHGDTWYAYNTVAHIQAVDGTAPTVLNNYKVSGGRHQKGNTIYVSVAFSEIVTVTGTPTLISNWGPLSYTAGSGSNVLTFKGTINPTDNNPFYVSRYSGIVKDLAGNRLSGYINKNFGTTIDTDYSWSTADFQQLSTNAYEVASKHDLRHLALLVNNGHNNCRGLTFKQTQDITCDSTYIPIGYYNDNDDTADFRGTYDGQGHTVSGIIVTRTGNTQADDHVGIFGFVNYKTSSDYGTERNVVLANSTFTARNYVGGIVGQNKGTVENCRVENTVTIEAGMNMAYRYGGIVGENGGSNAMVIGCISAATVSKNSKNSCQYFGGITGYNDHGTVKNCLYTGTTVTAASSKGAIVGDDYGDGEFTNNYYTSINLGGINGSDQDGARRARRVTLNENITLGGRQTAYSVSGLTAIGIGNNALRCGSSTYSGEGQTITLSCDLDGYFCAYTVTDGTNADITSSALSGNILTMPAANVTVSATFTDVWGIADGADGTAAHPYLITTPEGLILLSDRSNTSGFPYGKNFKLGADIDMSGVPNFSPIADPRFSNGFRCYFYGDGHTISHLTINKPDNNEVALFGELNCGYVGRVILDGADITGKKNVAGLVGYRANGYIDRCLVINSTVTANANSAAIITPSNITQGTVTRNYYYNCKAVRNGDTVTNNIGTTSGDINVGDNHNAIECTAVSFNVTAGQWQAIASPLHNDGHHQDLGFSDLARGNYDLFSYYEPNAVWDNIGRIDRGPGYIYRSATSGTRTFYGMVHTKDPNIAHNISFGYDLKYSCGEASLKGFNLVGNPYNQPITFSNISVTDGHGAIAPGYYTLEPDGSWQAHTSGTIAPGQGFLLQATEPYSSGQSYTHITITEPNQSKGGNQSEPNTRNTLTFTVSNGEYSDIAYAIWGNENEKGLRKFGHQRADLPSLSIAQGDGRYAVAPIAEETRSFDMAFRGKAGEYKLSIGNIDTIGYLHLIDRATGRDIDLLRDSTYTFTHSSNQTITNRFLVKFSPKAGRMPAVQDYFAYNDGDQVVVTGEGTLTVYDAMGRELFRKEMKNEEIRMKK